VVSALAASPLALRNPQNHGHAAWVFQSSLGGGFVGADDVALAVEVAPRASLFLSSQASSKVYRAARGRYSLEAVIGAGATLVSWPDPVTCFAGASFEQTQRFVLDKSATLIAVDAWTSGRAASGERWAFERFLSRITVEIFGERVLHDATLLTPAAGDLAARMGRLNAFATVVSTVELAAENVSRWPWGQVVRLGAPSAEELGAELRKLLAAPVASLLGDDPMQRKW
jgi:urease accessory protein